MLGSVLSRRSRPLKPPLGPSGRCAGASRWSAAAIVLALVPGCGDDDDGGPGDAGGREDAAALDAGADAAERDGGADPDGGSRSDPLDPLTPLDGHVRLVESDWGATADVRFTTAAWPTEQELVARSGACALYRARTPGFCDPPCGEYELCTPDAECLPSPQRISAGTIRVQAPSWDATATPDESFWYELADAPADDLFEAGDPVEISAAGGDVAAFAITISGVTDARPADLEIVLTDGRDAVIELRPEDDGALVELVLQTGWHGAPAEGILWCTAAAGDSELTIAASLVEQFPPAGGAGLFPHPSFLRRVHRRLIDDPSGTIEVSLASEASLSVTH